MLQIPAHGIAVNVKLKSPYNPGLAATVFLQLPIGIYYIWYVVTNNLAGGGTFVIGAIASVAALMVLFLIPIALLRSRNSKYPFAEEEMYGFAAEKIKAMKR